MVSPAMQGGHSGEPVTLWTLEARQAMAAGQQPLIRTVQGAHMGSVMFGKLYACGCFLPELQVSINTSSKQKVLILCHSYLRNYVPVHKAFLIHLRTGQSSQVGLLVLKNLQTQAHTTENILDVPCLP